MDVTYLSAFGGGLISFFTPCVCRWCPSISPVSAGRTLSRKRRPEPVRPVPAHAVFCHRFLHRFHSARRGWRPARLRHRPSPGAVPPDIRHRAHLLRRVHAGVAEGAVPELREAHGVQRRPGHRLRALLCHWRCVHRRLDTLRGADPRQYPDPGHGLRHGADRCHHAGDLLAGAGHTLPDYRALPWTPCCRWSGR